MLWNVRLLVGDGTGFWGEGVRNPHDLETQAARASVRKHGCCVDGEESGLKKCVCMKGEWAKCAHSEGSRGVGGGFQAPVCLPT